jgi:hypothetical protein
VNDTFDSDFDLAELSPADTASQEAVEIQHPVQGRLL